LALVLAVFSIGAVSAQDAQPSPDLGCEGKVLDLQIQLLIPMDDYDGLMEQPSYWGLFRYANEKGRLSIEFQSLCPK